MPEANPALTFRAWCLAGVAALLLAAMPAEAHVVAKGAACSPATVYFLNQNNTSTINNCYNDVEAPAGTGGVASTYTHIGNRCVANFTGTNTPSLGTADRAKGRFGGLISTYHRDMGHLTSHHRLWDGNSGNGEWMMLHVC